MEKLPKNDISKRYDPDSQFAVYTTSDFIFESEATGTFIKTITGSMISKGLYGKLDLEDNVQITYASILPSESFLWRSYHDISREPYLSLIYILQAYKNTRSKVGELESREVMSAKTMFVDGSKLPEKTVLLLKNETFEIFQIELPERLFLEYMEKSSPLMYQKYLAGEKNHIFEKHNRGILFPMEAKEEKCVSDILNLPLREELIHTFSLQKMGELFIYFFAKLISKDESLQAHVNEVSDEEKQKMAELKSLIDDFDDEKLDFNKLCRKFYMTEENIKQQFYNLFGEHLTAYYKKQKLNKAYNLLLDKNNQISIKEIAYRFGYSSVANFSRAFFNEFKIRPSDIQQK